MISYDEAIERILIDLQPLNVVETSLLDAHGQVLGVDLTTPIDMPPFANSQMDGYALMAADTAGASTESPVRLSLHGEIAAGKSAHPAVAPGATVKIFTGAPMPPGADSVTPIEDTSPVLAGKAAVDILAEAIAGQFVRAAGEDYRNGDVVLERGTLVGPAAIALAAASGHAKVAVHRRPRVCVIGTGDELVAPGLPLSSGQIYDSNSFAIAAQVVGAGATCVRRLHAADSISALTAALTEAESLSADVIVTCGGVSVGDHDLVRPVFANRGEIDFWRVAIRPGKPVAFGRVGRCLFFGLPGNPASAMVTFELFVRPALLRLMGRADPHRPIVTATLTEAVDHEPGRRSFMRAVAVQDESGTYRVKSAGRQGSHLLHSLVAANALLIVPEDVESLPAGASVRVMLL